MTHSGLSSVRASGGIAAVRWSVVTESARRRSFDAWDWPSAVAAASSALPATDSVMFGFFPPTSLSEKSSAVSGLMTPKTFFWALSSSETLVIVALFWVVNSWSTFCPSAISTTESMAWPPNSFWYSTLSL